MQNEFRYNSLKGKPFYYTLVIPALLFQFNLHLTYFISVFLSGTWLAMFCSIWSKINYPAIQQLLSLAEMTPLHRDKEARTTTVIYRPLSLPLDKKYLHGVCISIRSGTYQIMSLLATIRAQTNKGTGVTGLYHMPPRPESQPQIQ